MTMTSAGTTQTPQAPSLQPIDVSGVLNRHAQGLKLCSERETSLPVESLAKIGRDLEKVQLVFERLLEEAKKAQTMMDVPERITPRHRQALCDAISDCDPVPGGSRPQVDESGLLCLLQKTSRQACEPGRLARRRALSAPANFRESTKVGT